MGKSFIVLFTIQFICSLVVINWFDKNVVELFGIDQIKKAISEKTGSKLKTGFTFTNFSIFTVYTWQFVPPIALLLMRPGGIKWSRGREVLMLAYGSLFLTVFWLGLFSPIMLFICEHLFKSN